MKYILIGGEVKSRDGDVHYISSHKLAELYRLNPRDCYFSDESKYSGFYDNLGNSHDIVWLRPRSEGDYKEYLEMIFECCERDRESQEDTCFNCIDYWECRHKRPFKDICIAYDRMR